MKDTLEFIIFFIFLFYIISCNFIALFIVSDYIKKEGLDKILPEGIFILAWPFGFIITPLFIAKTLINHYKQRNCG